LIFISVNGNLGCFNFFANLGLLLYIFIRTASIPGLCSLVWTTGSTSVLTFASTTSRDKRLSKLLAMTEMKRLIACLRCWCHISSFGTKKAITIIALWVPRFNPCVVNSINTLVFNHLNYPCLQNHFVNVVSVGDIWPRLQFILVILRARNWDNAIGTPNCGLLSLDLHDIVLVVLFVHFFIGSMSILCTIDIVILGVWNIWIVIVIYSYITNLPFLTGMLILNLDYVVIVLMNHIYFQICLCIRIYNNIIRIWMALVLNSIIHLRITSSALGRFVGRRIIVSSLKRFWLLWA
jgi:hypothetical protein